MQTQAATREDLKTPWTPAQRAKRLQDAIRLAEHGPGPEGAVTAAVGAAAPIAVSGPIQAADMLALEYRAEPYTLHNGSVVWVHPVSIDEAAWLNCKAWGEVSPLGLTDERAVSIQFVMRAQVWQVVACLRCGPETNAEKAMQAEHAEILRRNAGWLPDVQAIVAISDRLTGGATESERLKAALHAFFEGAESFCETLRSQLSTATPEELQAVITGFAGSVSLAKSRLSPGSE